MEYQKIKNLLDDTPNQPSKFRTRNWVEINDKTREINDDNINNNTTTTTTTTNNNNNNKNNSSSSSSNNNNNNNNNNNDDNNNNIRFKTSMIRSSLSDSCDAYILVKGTVTVPDTAA